METKSTRPPGLEDAETSLSVNPTSTEQHKDKVPKVRTFSLNKYWICSGGDWPIEWTTLLRESFRQAQTHRRRDQLATCNLVTVTQLHM